MSRMKCIRQRDTMQCGAACVSMICQYYGLPQSLEEVSEMCTATPEGVSMQAIKTTLETLGFITKAVRSSADCLRTMHLPAILYWNGNHFTVLYKIDRKKRFYIADPAKGKLRYSCEEFMELWQCVESHEEKKGIVLSIEPTEIIASTRKSPKTASTSKPFKFLSSYLKRFKFHLSLVILGLGLGCLLQLIIPFLTQAIVDIGIRQSDIKLIWLILLGELMIVIGNTSTDIFRRWLLLHVSMRINLSLVSEFFIKLLKLPMSFFDRKLMGDLLQRIGDHSRVQDFLTGQVLNIVFSILSFIIFGIVLLFYDTLIFVIFSIGSVCYGVWIASFLKKRKIIDYELFEQQADNQNMTYQFVTCMQEIKLQNCEKRRLKEWESTQVALFNIQMKSLRIQQMQQAGSIFINEIKNILITVLAATAVINGQMTFGAMLAVQYIIGQLNSPVEQLMTFIYSLQDVKISLERINEVHSKENEETDCNFITAYGRSKAIRFSDVNFKYDKHALHNTLENVSFDIPEGKVTAIVGPSGSGKTTLIKLMLGYYPVASGSLEISGMPIENINLKWWRNQCGVVMQDGVIFSESIARNIVVGDEDIDNVRMEDAARIANIHDYIMRLPLKYNTVIGRDGIGLSQGQKQRILIARAVYKNPQYIFFDEATNALDARNEREIVENLHKFYKGKTVVIVAHRLSTVKNADNIIVIDNGKIAEIGNHESLTERKGIYYNLVKNQLELGN